MKPILTTSILISAILLLGPFPVSADDTQCSGTLPPGVYDNVVVPPQAFCEISPGSAVRGNVKALQHSTLFMSGGTTVRGNIGGDQADFILIFTGGADPNIIHGNVEASEGLDIALCGAILPNGNIHVLKFNPQTNFFIGGGPCSSLGGGNVVRKGNIVIEDIAVRAEADFDIRSNMVGGNLRVLKITGPGAKAVQNNTVRGTLQCFEIDPPFVGSPNVAGQTQGQCVP